MTWRYSPDRKVIVKYWAMFIIGNIFALVCAPLTMAKIMDMIQKEGVSKQNFGTMCLLLASNILIHTIFWCFHGPARLTEKYNAFKVKANYRKYLLQGVLGLSLDWHTDHHSGDTIDKIEKGTSGLYSFSEGSFVVISSFVKLVISYCMLVYVCHSAAVIIFVMLGMTVLITMKFDKVIAVDYRKINASENAISTAVYDTISNITTVIILRVAQPVFRAVCDKIDKPFELFKTNSVRIEWKWYLTGLCCTVTFVLVLGTYLWQHIGVGGGALVGSVYLIIKYLDQITELFYVFTSRYGDIIRYLANVKNAKLLSDDFTEESLVDHVLPSVWKSVDVSGLNFAYPSEDSEKLHLHGVSLTIRHGEKIAFVGKSGGGKTTMFKVIRSLHKPQSMTLSVDGNLVPQGFDGISQAIALVPQCPEIFNRSIRDNITMGADYSEDLIWWALDIACFADTVRSLPHGLDSLINEKGVNLSGGQQQRLALARGILACLDKSIVLLDEPTSGLDFLTDMDVHRKIFAAFKDVAIISSVHRLHLLPIFDRICMFEDGRIVGSGTYNELMATCPQFQTLWSEYSKTSPK